MSFDLSLTPAHHDLVQRTHAFAEEVVRSVAPHYDREEEFPWPVLERAAEEGFYNALFYRDLIADPTRLSLPLFREELFWGCAGIGLAAERGECPLHHMLPGRQRIVAKALARGTRPRSRAGMSLLRLRRVLPPGLLRMAMIVLSPPRRHRGSGD